MNIKIAVTHKNVLCVILVVHIPVIVAESPGGRIIIIILCPRIRKLSARARLSRQHVARHKTSDIPKLPHKDNRVNPFHLSDRGSVNHSAHIEEQYRLLIIFRQELKVLNFPVCQKIIALPAFSVFPLAGIARKHIDGCLCIFLSFNQRNLRSLERTLKENHMHRHAPLIHLPLHALHIFFLRLRNLGIKAIQPLSAQNIKPGGRKPLLNINVLPRVHIPGAGASLYRVPCSVSIEGGFALIVFKGERPVIF